jgi:hypothetical protein
MVWNVDSMLPEHEDGSKKIQAGHTSVSAQGRQAASGQRPAPPPRALDSGDVIARGSQLSTPGTCASALGRLPPSSSARRLLPSSSAAAQPHARPWGAGRNRAVVVLLATAQREAQLALAHGLLNASTLRLSGSASPVRQRPPWSPTRTRRSVLLRVPSPDGRRV